MKPDGIYLTNYNKLRFKFHANRGWHINYEDNWPELHDRLSKGGGWFWSEAREKYTKATVVPGELWSW